MKSMLLVLLLTCIWQDWIFIKFRFLIKFSCCSRPKIENKFPSPHLRLIKTWNFTSGGIQYRAKWETGDSTAVTSIQDRFFRGFTISELFRSEHSTFPIMISFTKFSSSALEKQLRNRETR